MESYPPQLEDCLHETLEGIFHFGMPQVSVNPSMFLMWPYPSNVY